MQRAGGATPDEASDISIDAGGNTYTTGYFTGAADFGTTTLHSSGVTDIFIAKIDNTGNYVWAVKAGGPGSDRALSIKADAAGNSYITGFYYGTASFGSQTITAVGIQDLFIAKYNNAGVLQWVKSAGGASADIGNGITIDNSGNVVVTGEFSGTASFGGFSLSSLYNSTDVFTTKLDGNGNFLWAKKGSGASTDRGIDAACDASENVFVTGQYSDTITFDAAHNNTINNAIFLIKYNSSGQEQWFRKIGGGTMNNVSGIAIDANDNIYLTGDFTGGVIFFGTPNITLTNTYANRIFTAKYDNSGTFQWGHADGSSNDLTSKNITLDASGNAYIIGNFKCILNDYADQYGQGTFNSVGYWDIFVTKYNAAGAWQWSRQCGSRDNDNGAGIAVNSAGQVHIAGSFYQQMNFPFTSGFLGYHTNEVNNNWWSSYCSNSNYFEYQGFTSAGNSDILIAKNFDPARATYDYYTRTGTGCGKPYVGVCINKLNLTNCPDTITFCGDNNLIYAYSNTNDVWYSNNNAGPDFNYLWSTGQTTKYITVTTTGYYSVKQTSFDGCFVSSDTVYVIKNTNPPFPTISDNVVINTNSQNPASINLCLPDSVRLTGGSFGTYSYNWTGGNLPSNGLAVQSTTVSTTGTYYFTVKDSNGCTASTPISAYFYPGLPPFKPKIKLYNEPDLTDSTKTCSCFQIQLYDSISNPAANYAYLPTVVPYSTHTTWSVSPNMPHSDFINTFGTFCPTASGTYIITARIIRVNICASDTFYLSKTIYVDLLSNFTFTGNTALCPGDSTLLKVSGGDGITYKWTRSGYSQVLSTDSSLWIYQPGSYRVDGISSCYGTVYVSTSPQPVISMNPASGTCCPGDSIQLTCNGSGTFVWQGQSGTIGGNSSVVYVKTQGSYYCVRTDAGGCTLVSNTAEVNQYATPYLAVTPSTVLCAGDSVVISVITSVGAAIQWQAPFSGSGTQKKVTSPGTYTCSVTSCGIQTFASIIITQSTPIAHISASGPLTFCRGDSVVLSANSGMSNYVWQPGSLNQQAIDVSLAGTYSLTTLDSYGCTASSSAVVTVVDAPMAMFSFSNTCLHDSEIFSNTSTPPSSGSITGWLWNFGDSSPLNALQQPSHVYAGTGPFNVTLIASSNNGCKDSITKTLVIHPVPDAKFSTLNICVNHTTQFNDSSSIAASDTLHSWIWNFGDGSPASTLQYPQHIYTSAGTYGVSLITTTNNACKDTISKSIIIHPFPDAQFSTSNVCNGNRAHFSDSASIPAPDSIHSWKWNFGDGSPVNTNQVITGGYLYAAAGIYNVQLTAVSNFGCADSISKTITIYSNPIAAFGTANICKGNTTNFTDSSTAASGVINSWTWNFGDGSPLNTLQHPSHLYTNAGTYGVSLIITASTGCKDSIFKNIIIHPIPVVHFSTANVCDKIRAQFNDSSSIPLDSIHAWLWNFGDGSAVYSNRFITNGHLYAAAGNYNVRLTAVSNFGCTDSISKTITVYSNPAAAFGFTKICLGNTTQFTDSSSAVSGSISSWSWNFGDGTSINPLQHPVHIYAGIGTYSVSLSVMNSDGCRDSILKSIVIHPLPNVHFSAGDICDKNKVQFIDSSSIQADSIHSWAWNFGDGSVVNPNQSITGGYLYAAPGTYTAKLTAVSNFGCLDSISKIITVHPKPAANFKNTTVCEGSSTQFTDTSTTALGSITAWSWNYGDGSALGSIQNPSRIYASGGLYTVSLTAVNNFGCADTTTKPVQVYFNPAADFSHSDVCFPDSMHFTNTSTVNLPASISHYLWLFGDSGPTGNTASPAHYYIQSGTYSVTMISNTADGCSGAATHTVKIYDAPQASFSKSSICLRNGELLNNTTIPPLMGSTSSWNWNFGDNTPPDTSHWNAFHYYPSPGIYHITLITRSSNLGCADTVKDSITVYPMPAAGYSFRNVCLNQVMNFYDSSVILSGSIVSHSWIFGDGGAASPNINPSRLYVNPGTYPVSLIVTSSFGCKDTITKSAVVHPLPHAGIAANNVCSGSPMLFNDASFISSTDTIHSWRWNFADSSPLANTENTSHLYQAIGAYHVQLYISSNFGCIDSVIKIVKVNPNPVVNFTSSDSAGCEPLCINFLNASNIASGSNISFNWNFGDGSLPGTGQAPHHCYNNDSVFATRFVDVTLTVTSDSGCVSLKTKNHSIAVYPAPNANFSVQPASSSIVNPVISIKNLSTGADFWRWNFGSLTQLAPGADTSTLSNPAPLTYADTGTYVITLITSTVHNCIDTAYKTVIIEPDFVFYIPNTFSPNDDGINDKFSGKGIFIKEYEMKIFDRWGNLIFYTDDLNKGWDGIANHGSAIAYQDTYVYIINIIDFNRNKHSYKGIVTLVQ